MVDEIAIYLTITDFDCDPDEISNLLKLTPTKIYRIGELRIPQSILRNRTNGWKLKSSLSQSTIEEQVEHLLEQIRPCYEIITELGKKYEIEISCHVHCGVHIPAIHFNNNIIKQLAQLNASIDVDIYVFPEDEDEDNS